MFTKLIVNVIISTIEEKRVNYQTTLRRKEDSSGRTV